MPIILFLLTKLMTVLCFCGSASAAALASTTSVQAKSAAPLNGKANVSCKYFGQRCVWSYSTILHLLQLLV
jgi:hypothetical protein